jgi:DNA-binding response OmpR family regulator
MNTAQNKEPLEQGQRLILLVDDDALLLALLRTTLQAAGYATCTASSARTALGILMQSAREPDLAVLDISMPGMSGLELARRLQDETTVPVMFLSANDDPDSISRAAEYGAVGYLVKPIDLMQLVPSIKASLARADQIRALRHSQSRLTQAARTGRNAGMAAGLLMERYKLDRELAFRLLRDHARSQQRKIGDVADELLSAAEALNALSERVSVAGARK